MFCFWFKNKLYKYKSNLVTDKLYIKSITTVRGTSLAVVETFTYLGSTLTSDGSLDVKIN